MGERRSEERNRRGSCSTLETAYFKSGSAPRFAPPTSLCLYSQACSSCFDQLQSGRLRTFAPLCSARPSIANQRSRSPDILGSTPYHRTGASYTIHSSRTRTTCSPTTPGYRPAATALGLFRWESSSLSFLPSLFPLAPTTVDSVALRCVLSVASARARAQQHPHFASRPRFRYTQALPPHPVLHRLRRARGS